MISQSFTKKQKSYFNSGSHLRSKGNGCHHLPIPYPSVVTFSEPVDRATVGDQTIALKDAAGNVVPGAFSFSPDGAVVTLYPAAALKSETIHTLTVGSAIRDLQGYPLKQAVTSSFTVRDTTPPPPPPAGSITATFPDEEGMITVTATQGSAESDCTVLVINDTTGEIVSVSPQTNGSFTARINAQLGDEIQVVLMDEAGNQTLISYLTFKAPDGRYLVTARGGKIEGEGGSLLEIPEGALVGPAVVRITPVLEGALPHVVPAEGQFLAAVNVDTGGIPFQKEVHLSIPLPADLPEGAVPFLAQPKVHVNPDGTEEEVYVVIDSTKIVNGRLTTASPPFAGPTGFGIFTFLFTPVPLEGPVIVSGTTYRDMDGLGGYMAGVDVPIRGAVIRNPGAENFIAYSDANGHYATYGFTARDVCRNFAITAIHPQTMLRNTANITTCDAPYIVNNLNFKLADKDTEVPDRTPPSIDLNLQVAPGQTAVFAAGTIPVDTELLAPISILETDVPAVTLSIEFKTPDTSGPETIGGLSASYDTSELHTPMEGDKAAIYRYVYKANFSGNVAGSDAGRFKPTRAGTYTFIVEATDDDGNRSVRRQAITAVSAQDVLDGVEGAPFALELLPGDGAEEIMVTTPVTASFNEPVENVTADTFKLIDLTTGAPVPAYVYTSVEGGRMRAILQPKNNLHYGRAYQAELTAGITDTHKNAGGENLPLDIVNNLHKSAFTTKQPKGYGLESAERFPGGRDIALYERDGRSYAIVAAGAGGWHVLDISDPTRPQKIFGRNLSNSGMSWEVMGVAVDPQSGILAMIENIRYASGNQYGYIRFFDLSRIGSDVTTLETPVGREKLAEAYSAIPVRVALQGGYAYVVSVNVGLQVVDVQAALDFEGPSDGSTIVGLYNPLGDGYGNAFAMIPYAGGKGLLGATGGYLLTLDLSTPQMPRVMADFRPDGTHLTRFAVAAEYAYLDRDGLSRSVDFAVAGTREGRLVTVDLTDPYQPSLLGVAKDSDGNEVATLVRDVIVAKNSGLAFVTTFGAIQVFDVKDPAHPLLLDTITTLPDEDGNPVPVGNVGELFEKGGWLYMAHATEGMRVADFDPVLLKLYCGEIESEWGTNAGNLATVGRDFCEDYYPVLGEKEILLEGVDFQNAPLKSPARVQVMHVRADGKQATDVTVRSFRSGQAGDKPAYASFNESGIARFYIGASPGSDYGRIEIDFQIDPSTMPGFDASVTKDTSPLRKTVNLDVRHNGNVTLAEVIGGNAVFVADDRHEGKSEEKNDPYDQNRKKFDYVEELLNQVVPRKRSASAYKLIEEDGKYTAADADAVKMFREQFGMGDTKVAFTTSATGAADYGSDDNTSLVFRKLSKDYGIRAKGAAETQKWLHKIIEKDTLVGNVSNLYMGETMAEENPVDQEINAPGKGTDTGLYELYVNVVKRFVDRMSEEGERYAGLKGTRGDTAPTDEWTARTGEGSGDGENSHGPGMAYSFGGKQTIAQFNSDVSPCNILSSDEKATRQVMILSSDRKGVSVSSCARCHSLAGVDPETYPTLKIGQILDGNVPANYSGNINPSGCTYDGNKQFSGLKDHEYYWWYNNSSKAYLDKFGESLNYANVGQQYSPDYWSGIDCSGFAQQAILSAKNLTIPGVEVKIKSTWLLSSDFVQPLTYVNNLKLGGYVDANGKELFDWKVRFDKSHRFIKRGDVISYSGHVAIAASDAKVIRGEVYYEIFNAYGGNMNNQYKYPKHKLVDKDKKGKTVFGRKVMKTWNNIWARPINFGRITFW